MGMCLLTCDICCESFTDYDDYKQCEGCGNMWCESCAHGKKFKEDEFGETLDCPVCRNKELFRLSENLNDARIKFVEAVKGHKEIGK